MRGVVMELRMAGISITLMFAQRGVADATPGCRSGARAHPRVCCAAMSTRAPRLRLPASVVPVLLALTLVLLAAVPVLAHADLLTADPPDGAVLDAPPASITLTFSEGLDAAKAGFKVLDASGAVVAKGTATRNGATRLTADGLALAPGAYTIRWTSVAEDGHVLRGTLAFAVNEPTPAPTAAPTAVPTTAPSTEAPSDSPSTEAPSDAPFPAPVTPAPTPAASASSGGRDSSSGLDALLPIVLGVAVVAVIGALVLRRSRAA